MLIVNGQLSIVNWMLSEYQAGFFAFAETEQEVDDKADKGNGRDQPPQGLFADGAEIFLRYVDNRPDSGQ